MAPLSSARILNDRTSETSADQCKVERNVQCQRFQSLWTEVQNTVRWHWVNYLSTQKGETKELAQNWEMMALWSSRWFSWSENERQLKIYMQEHKFLVKTLHASFVLMNELKQPNVLFSCQNCKVFAIEMNSCDATDFKTPVASIIPARLAKDSIFVLYQIQWKCAWKEWIFNTRWNAQKFVRDAHFQTVSRILASGRAGRTNNPCTSVSLPVEHWNYFPIALLWLQISWTIEKNEATRWLYCWALSNIPVVEISGIANTVKCFRGCLWRFA